jgi:hypothetical protein
MYCIIIYYVIIGTSIDFKIKTVITAKYFKYK